MSRLANKPIALPAGVDLSVNGSNVVVKGKLGELTREFFDYILISQEDGNVWVKGPKLDNVSEEEAKKIFKRQYSAGVGLSFRLLANMIEGVSTGYKKVLLLEGVGYRSNIQGNVMTLQLGFSSDIKLTVPEGLKVTIEKDTKITIEGIDKELVGEFAMIIKKKRPVEPYQGKGVRFEGERVRRKEGKKASK